MEWSAVLKSPYFKNLPFKIELNKWGQVLMSPASNNHGRWQYKTGTYIDKNTAGGEIITECSVKTPQGVKVADVAWLSDSFIDQYGFETPYSVAPEICVEIVSPSNSQNQMKEKVQLYLAQGALEVWLVDQDGQVRYFSNNGEIKASTLLIK